MPTGMFDDLIPAKPAAPAAPATARAPASTGMFDDLVPSRAPTAAAPTAMPLLGDAAIDDGKVAPSRYRDDGTVRPVVKNPVQMPFLGSDLPGDTYANVINNATALLRPEAGLDGPYLPARMDKTDAQLEFEELQRRGSQRNPGGAGSGLEMDPYTTVDWSPLTDEEILDRAPVGSWVKMDDGRVVQRDLSLTEGLARGGARGVNLLESLPDRLGTMIETDSLERDLRPEVVPGKYGDANVLPGLGDLIDTLVQGMGGTPLERRARVNINTPEGAQNVAGRVAGIAADTSRRARVDDIAGRGLEPSLAQQDFQRETELMPALGALVDEPLGIGGPVAVESLVQFAPALAAMLVTKNPRAGMAIAGGTSAGLEFADGLREQLSRRGIDPADEAAITAALSDPATLRDLLSDARTRAGIIGGMDALGAGVASRTLAPTLLEPLRRGAVNLGAQTVVGGTIGGTGEGLAQVATGDDVNWSSILSEVVAEGATAPGEAIALGGQANANARAERDASRAAALQTAIAALDPNRNGQPTAGGAVPGAPVAAPAPAAAAGPGGVGGTAPADDELDELLLRNLGGAALPTPDAGQEAPAAAAALPGGLGAMIDTPEISAVLAALTGNPAAPSVASAPAASVDTGGGSPVSAGGVIPSAAPATLPPAAAPAAAPVAPAMYMQGKKAQAVRLADGTWRVRHRQSGQWQPWRKPTDKDGNEVDTFDPSPAFGYRSFTPAGGAVKIDGKQVRLAPREAPAAKAAGPKKPRTLLQALFGAKRKGLKFNGLNRAAFVSQGIDPKDDTRVGIQRLFTTKGDMQPDDLREWMVENGYLPRDADNAPAESDINAAMEKLFAAINGEDVFSDEQDVDVAEYRAWQNAENEAMGDQLVDQFPDLDDADLSSAYGAADLLRRADALGLDPQVDAFDDAEEGADYLAWLEGQVNRAEAANGADDEAREGDRQPVEGPVAAADRIPAQPGEPGRPAPAGAARAGTGNAQAADVPGEVDDDAPSTGVRQQGSLFGKPSAREAVDDERRRRDERRDGKTGTGRTDMAAGDGDLFAGDRPDQGDIDDDAPPSGVKSTVGLFGRTRGEQRQADAAARGAATPAAIDPGLPKRPDSTPTLLRRADLAIDRMLARNGGSVLADLIARDFRTTGAAALIGRTIKTGQDFAAMADAYRNAAWESLRYVFVRDGVVVGETAVSTRMPGAADGFPTGFNSTAGDPTAGAKWLLAEAKKHGATGFWMAHNHPSGNPDPSQADLKFTSTLNDGLRKLADGGNGTLKLLGHVVLNHTRYTLIEPTGTAMTRDLPRAGADPLQAPRGDTSVLGAETASPDQVATVAQRMFAQTPLDSVTVIVASFRNKVQTVYSLPIRALLTKRGAGTIMTAGRKSGGAQNFLVLSEKNFAELRDVILPAARAGFWLDVFVVAPNGNARSLAKSGDVNGRHLSSLLDRDRVQRSGRMRPPNSGRLYQGDAPKDMATTPADDAGDRFADFIGRAMRRRVMDEHGQNILDDMIDEGVSPAEVSRTFWHDTYWRLPAAVQQRFQRMLAEHTGGMEPGRLIATSPDGDVIAEDWQQIADEGADLPTDAEYLEGTDRGFVVLMHEANTRFGDDAATGAARPLERLEQKRAPYNASQTAALTKAGLPTTRRSFLGRIADRLRASWQEARAALTDGDALRQSIADRFHGLRAAEARLGMQAPETSPYLAARMTTGLPSIMESLLSFGAPEWNGGVLGLKAGTKGLLDALEPVRGRLDDWLGWMVGRRAQLLASQGRENNLDPADIQALLSLAGNDVAAFQQAAKDYLKIKNAVLDVAEKAGLIDPIARAAWDHAEYIPFYRAENEKTIGPGTRRGLEGQSSGIRTLKGGENALADPLANIVRNFTRLLDASLKNRAVLLAVDQFGAPIFTKAPREIAPASVPMSEVKKALLDQGVPQATIDAMPASALQGIQRMKSIVPPTGDDVVRVMRDGKAEYYKVEDPLVMRALTAFREPHKNAAVKIGIFFKRLLTAGVTTTAEFVAANFIRDSAAAWVISDDRFKPGWDSLTSVVKTLRNDKTTQEMMMAGATFLGGQFYGGDADAAAAALRRALRKKGLSIDDTNEFLETVARSPLKLWDTWLRLSSGVENANRRAVYDAAIANGKTPTEAAYLARDLMDFAMQGDAAWIQLAGDVLPFFNARLQGLYKLGRRAATPEGKRAILLRGSIITMFSLGLLAWNAAMHADAYDELEEWDKDTYWHIAPGTEFHVRIPKPFELGILFGTLPERIARAITGQVDGGDTGDRPGQTFGAAWRAITGTLAINPVPQAALPIVEQWANQRFFTGRPIENLGDERLLPELREEWYTSDTAKLLADAQAQIAPRPLQMSAKRIEHLWNGYTGGLGAYLLEASDAAVRGLQDEPTRPAMALRDLPLVGRFARGDNPPQTTRYVTELYDLISRAEEIEQSVKAYRRRVPADVVDGEGEEPNMARALEMQESEAWLLGDIYYSRRLSMGFGFRGVQELRKVQRDMSGIRQEMDDVAMSETLNAAEKRQQLDALTARRNELARNTVRKYRTRESGGGSGGGGGAGGWEEIGNNSGTPAPVPFDVRGLRNAPRMAVVGDHSSLPEHIRGDLDNGALGAYDRETQTAYVVMGLPADQSKFVAFHEVAGHHGLKSVLNGNQREAVLGAAAENPTVGRLRAAMRSAYPDAHPVMLTEEALSELAAARMSGDYDRIEAEWGVAVPASAREGVEGLLARSVASAKTRIARILGEPAETYSDEQVLELLRDAWRRVSEGPAR